MASEVEAFVREARVFCTFVERATLEAGVGAVEARARLLALYAAALSLPVVEPSADDRDRAAPGDVPAVTLDALDVYWIALAPHDMADDRHGAGSLVDDFSDIYHEIREGLALWDEGAEVDAVWQWRFSFLSHWGDHAANALWALHHGIARSPL